VAIYQCLQPAHQAGSRAGSWPRTCTQLAHSSPSHQLRAACEILAERNRSGPHIQADQVGLVACHVAAQLLGVGQLLVRQGWLLCWVSAAACRRGRGVPIQQVCKQLLDIQLKCLRHAGDLLRQAAALYLQGVGATIERELVQRQRLVRCRHEILYTRKAYRQTMRVQWASSRSVLLAKPASLAAVESLAIDPQR
jgi:hypothetical protein